ENKMESSIAIPLPEFDLFGTSVVQTSIEQKYITKHRPLAAIESSQIIEFVIPSTENEYIYLDDSLLYLKAQIQIPNAENLNEWEKICPANYFLQSIFKSIDLQIGEKQVTLSPQTYSYRSYFDAILNYGKNAQESWLTSAGFDKDEVMDVAIDKDKVFATRMAKIKQTDDSKKSESKVFELFGKLHLDLVMQQKAILGGSLKFSPARYPITRTEVKAMTIPSNLSNVFLDNIIIGRVPNKIYLAF
ncbi:hypothetical protein B4U79_02068, partial [Dinothrombium tinctorium]